ncbi:MAG: transposase [Bacteroidetes bacterium]|nr:transposase [Bacteroidota bacterium]
MSRKYKFRDQDQLYFISFAIVYWIDLFVRNIYKDILLESWSFCKEKKGMDIYGWCIMTSHVHMIIGSHQDRLENIMQQMKMHTSVKLKELIINNATESRKEWILELMQKAGKSNSNNNGFQLWQQDNHPIELTTLAIAHQKLDYIHNNPVEAGFVEAPEDYLYSSARDYYGRKGLIEIELLEPLLM